jgi:hypothetical protein
MVMSMNKLETLHKAFDELELLGYETSRGEWCCNTCASASFETDKFVFWHEQNEFEGDIDWLGWSGDGNEILMCLKDHVYKAEWNGDDNKKIKVEVWY